MIVDEDDVKNFSRRCMEIRNRQLVKILFLLIGLGQKIPFLKSMEQQSNLSKVAFDLQNNLITVNILQMLLLSIGEKLEAQIAKVRIVTVLPLILTLLSQTIGFGQTQNVMKQIELGM